MEDILKVVWAEFPTLSYAMSANEWHIMFVHGYADCRGGIADARLHKPITVSLS